MDYDISTNVVAEGSLQDAADKSARSLLDVMADMAALVAIDTSSSMTLQDAQDGVSRHEAAEQSLRNLQRDNPGKIGLIQFSNEAMWRPTGVPQRTGGMTNLAAALQLMLPYDGADVGLYVITDGEPNNENHCLELAGQFKQSKISTIFIGSGDGWRFLKKLADLTGGIFTKSTMPGDFEEPMRLLLAVNI